MNEISTNLEELSGVETQCAKFDQRLGELYEMYVTGDITLSAYEFLAAEISGQKALCYRNKLTFPADY